MKKGDVVTIFEDPITETKPEGKATLIRLLDRDMGIWEGRQFKRWAVRFHDEPCKTYHRTVGDRNEKNNNHQTK